MMGWAGLGALPRTWAHWARLMPLVGALVGRGQSLGKPRGVAQETTQPHVGNSSSVGVCFAQMPSLGINPWSWAPQLPAPWSK